MGFVIILGVQIAGIVWVTWVFKGEIPDVVGIAAAAAFLWQVWLIYRAPDGHLNKAFLACVSSATVAISAFAVLWPRSAGLEPSTEFWVGWILAGLVLLVATIGILRGMVIE